MNGSVTCADRTSYVSSAFLFPFESIDGDKFPKKRNKNTEIDTNS